MASTELPTSKQARTPLGMLRTLRSLPRRIKHIEESIFDVQNQIDLEARIRDLEARIRDLEARIRDLEKDNFDAQHQIALEARISDLEKATFDAQHKVDEVLISLSTLSAVRTEMLDIAEHLTEELNQIAETLSAPSTPQ
ncbi:MAG: hypothetical protein WD029_06315 [Microthrixaceae bacterium]